MDFNHFLSSYYPNKDYGGKQLYADMVEQAIMAENLGYRGVTVPEHHLINVLITPSPLQMAVKVAAVTERVEITTSVVVLPLHDMRIFAGEIVQADILTDERLILGVGRGAFAYETARMGIPIEDTREKFDESLNLLLALLSEEEVSWSGKYYNFESLTIMPRPVRPIPIMIAALVEPAIEACTRRGFSIQTTPLSATPEVFRKQVMAHKNAKAEMGDAGKDLRLLLSRVCFCTRNANETREKMELAYDYYSRFDNVFTGPGIVKNGMIDALPREQSIEELEQNLLICEADEMIDRLSTYDDLGVDEIIFNSNIGESQAETLDSMQRFANDVMPHFQDKQTAT
jgi:alkanesulfonate monooxygenase SsuD/methylene tetrahydromethanopterin reductase-like flavin-dependent oxidoreductase (luciferase family)